MKTTFFINTMNVWQRDGKAFMWEKHAYCLNCFEDFIYRTLEEDKEPVACPFCGCKREDEEKTKSSDFYPCADENGMVGR